MVLPLIGIAVVAISVVAAKKKIRKKCKDVINPKLREYLWNPLNKILLFFIKSLNYIFVFINKKTQASVAIFNIIIRTLENFIFDWVRFFNKIMNNMYSILDIFFNITSGHIIGWLSIMYLSIMNAIFKPFGLEVTLTTSAKIVSFLYYTIIFGNFYNIVDYLASEYESESRHNISNCSNY